VADEGCLAGAGDAPPPLLLVAAPPTEEDMFTFSSAGKPTFFVAGGKAIGLNEQTDLVTIKAAMGSQPLPHFQLDPETFEQFLRAYHT